MTILTLFFIAWLVTNFEPLQTVLINIVIKHNPKQIYIELMSILTCWKCLTFWIFTIASIVTLTPHLFTAGLVCSFLTIPIKKYLM